MSAAEGETEQEKSGQGWLKKLETGREPFLTDGTFFYCCAGGTFYMTKNGRPTAMKKLGYDRDAIAREFARRDITPLSHPEFVEAIAL